MAYDESPERLVVESPVPAEASSDPSPICSSCYKYLSFKEKTRQTRYESYDVTMSTWCWEDGCGKKQAVKKSKRMYRLKAVGSSAA